MCYDLPDDECCVYCERGMNDELTALPHYEDDGGSLLVVYSDGVMDLWVVENDGIVSNETFKVNYCPMCGRGLNDGE